MERPYTLQSLFVFRSEKFDLSRILYRKLHTTKARSTIYMTIYDGHMNELYVNAVTDVVNISQQRETTPVAVGQ